MVKISEKALAKINALQMQIAALQAQSREYAAGIAEGLGVPEGYALNLKTGEWVEPAEEKKPA
jgi:hypothetical protein